MVERHQVQARGRDRTLMSRLLHRHRTALPSASLAKKAFAAVTAIYRRISSLTLTVPSADEHRTTVVGIGWLKANRSR
jgi:hypothetical protein